MNTLLEKSYVAEAAIAANRIVKPGSTDHFVVAGAASADLLIGVTHMAPAANERVDVMVQGIADVKLGGGVTRGQWITSDATGQGVAAAPGAGVNASVIGWARQSGVSGDIIEVVIAPTRIQG